MLLNSLMGEGLAGMQQSQSKMLAAARDIARAGLPPGETTPTSNGAGNAPVSEPGIAVNDLNGQQSVPATLQSLSLSDRSQNGGDVVDALIEQRRQVTLFDASAKIVQTASDTLGHLIDDIS